VSTSRTKRRGGGSGAKHFTGAATPSVSALTRRSTSPVKRGRKSNKTAAFQRRLRFGRSSRIGSFVRGYRHGVKLIILSSGKSSKALNLLFIRRILGVPRSFPREKISTFHPKFPAARAQTKRPPETGGLSHSMRRKAYLCFLPGLPLSVAGAAVCIVPPVRA
jgi:hypothetical protein